MGLTNVVSLFFDVLRTVGKLPIDLAEPAQVVNPSHEESDLRLVPSILHLLGHDLWEKV